MPPATLVYTRIYQFPPPDCTFSCRLLTVECSPFDIHSSPFTNKQMRTRKCPRLHYRLLTLCPAPTGPVGHTHAQARARARARAQAQAHAYQRTPRLGFRFKVEGLGFSTYQSRPRSRLYAPVTHTPYTTRLAQCQTRHLHHRTLPHLRHHSLIHHLTFCLFQPPSAKKK